MKNVILIVAISLGFLAENFAQNVGIGTASPTAKLDVVGSLRIRGTGFPNIPRMGSVLTAVDGAGNAEWQRPVIFKTRGLPANQSIPKNQWTKIAFKSNDMELNDGLYFDPYNSVFSAPVKGAYHFDAGIGINTSSGWSAARIVVYRNGGFLKEHRYQLRLCDVCNDSFSEAQDILKYIQVRTYSINTIFYLEAYDQVWLEVLQSDDAAYMQLRSSASETWFTGHLVNRL